MSPLVSASLVWSSDVCCLWGGAQQTFSPSGLGRDPVLSFIFFNIYLVVLGLGCGRVAP